MRNLLHGIFIGCIFVGENLILFYKKKTIVCAALEVMDYNIGDTSAGSEYEIPLYVEDTEGMILYFVSAGEVFSVNSLNYIL